MSGIDLHDKKMKVCQTIPLKQHHWNLFICCSSELFDNIWQPVWVRVMSNLIPKVKDKNKKFLKATLSHRRFEDVPVLSSLQLSLDKSFTCGWISPCGPAGSYSRLWHFLYCDPSLSVTLSCFPLLQSKESTQRAHPISSSLLCLQWVRDICERGALL